MRCLGYLAVVAINALLASSPVRAQSIPGAVLAKHEPHHHVAFEDSVLRVLRVRVAGHDTTLLHEHDADYFWVALGASTVVNAKLGARDATITSPDLSVHFTPGHFAHVARNPGGSAFDNITVELLGRQTNPRNLCEAAVSGAPLRCGADGQSGWVRGATEHPAFETNELRVGIATMAPGSTMRSATSAPVWLIALDTLETSSLAIAGRGRWAGGVYRATGDSWSVKNQSGRQQKVITVIAGAR